MKLVAALSLYFLACTARALDTDDLLDRVDTALSVAGFQDNVRLRLSGTIAPRAVAQHSSVTATMAPSNSPR